MRQDQVNKLEEEYGGDGGQVIFQDTPVHTDTIGRPAWWYLGSTFVPQTGKEKRLATLHYHNQTHETVLLSYRAQQVRQIIGLLSRWFPLPLLDEIGREVMEGSLRHTEAMLLGHLLGALEVRLRQKQRTVSWRVLEEISQATGYPLSKKDIAKWMFVVKQRHPERKSDTLKVVQHLTIEKIIQETMSGAKKRTLCNQTIQYVKQLKKEGFITKDPEMTAWSLTRIILNQKGKQQDIPPALRATATRMTFRLRKILKMKSHL